MENGICLIINDITSLPYNSLTVCLRKNKITEKSFEMDSSMVESYKISKF